MEFEIGTFDPDKPMLIQVDYTKYDVETLHNVYNNLRDTFPTMKLLMLPLDFQIKELSDEVKQEIQDLLKEY